MRLSEDGVASLEPNSCHILELDQLGDLGGDDFHRVLRYFRPVWRTEQWADLPDLIEVVSFSASLRPAIEARSGQSAAVTPPAARLGRRYKPGVIATGLRDGCSTPTLTEPQDRGQHARW